MLILAPLRGVTINAFRRVFAAQIAEAGFSEAFAPFIPANPGIKVRDSYLKEILPFEENLVPQVITKAPGAMRTLLKAFKDAGYRRADLNAGCPFPMIVRRGRGAGLLGNVPLLERLVATGVEEMGEGNFSVKTRLGIDKTGEIDAILPVFAKYPLRFVTIHGRTARQMYSGLCDKARLAQIAASAPFKVVKNGDFDTDCGEGDVMVGRSFVRALGRRKDSCELFLRYMEESQKELQGDRPVLGRLKELALYWAESSRFWAKKWNSLKICRSLREVEQLLTRTLS